MCFFQLKSVVLLVAFWDTCLCEFCTVLEKPSFLQIPSGILSILKCSQWDYANSIEPIQFKENLCTICLPIQNHFHFQLGLSLPTLSHYLSPKSQCSHAFFHYHFWNFKFRSLRHFMHSKWFNAWLSKHSKYLQRIETVFVLFL